MAEITRLLERSRGVKQTLKITKAMYLISQAKSKKARLQHDSVTPFFELINTTIADVLRHSIGVKHPFFGRPDADKNGRSAGLVVVTGDKGLAGAYNHNVINTAVGVASKYQEAKIFVIGEMGRHLFPQKGLKIEEDFDYPASEPTLSRAWDMSRHLIELFKAHRLREIVLIYTQMVTPLKVEVRVIPLLPLDPNNPYWKNKGEANDNRMIYHPSVDAVISRLVPSFLAGALYGATVEGFCSENTSRMNAMKGATENGEEMLKGLMLRYNRLRQQAITQELTEIVGGAEALK